MDKIKIENAVKLSLLVLIVSTIWFFFGIDLINSLFNSNFPIVYTLFVLTYALLAMYFVLGLNPFEKPKIFFALTISLVIFNLVAYPMMVTKEGAVKNIPIQSQISSDLYIYRLLPDILPEMVKYFIVYPLTLSIGILLIAVLTERNRVFKEIVKGGI